MEKNKKDEIAYHVSGVAALEEYLKQKAQNHNNYKFYSVLERILQIRNEKFLYLTSSQTWNDKTDRESFNSEKYDTINFGKCFSYSKDENVAMWMLYGGINQKSGMIDFTKKGMSSILCTPQIDIGNFENEKFIKIKSLERDSFKLYCIDVIYYKKHKSGYYYIRRSDEYCNEVSNDVFDKLFGCKKVYPWRYENECRLICSIKRDLVESECSVVRIDLSHMDLGKSFDRIYRGPNCISAGLKELLPSNLDNTIDWSLCKECNKENK